MNNNEQRWEQVLQIMEKSMKSHKYQLWISELRLMKVDDELHAVFVSAIDPFKGAYVMKQYGKDLDKAAEIAFGAGYRIYVTYDKQRYNENDSLSVRDNEFAIVEGDNGYSHLVRMLLLTNSDVSDDELCNIVFRVEERVRREKMAYEDELKKILEEEEEHTEKLKDEYILALAKKTTEDIKLKLIDAIKKVKITEENNDVTVRCVCDATQKYLKREMKCNAKEIEKSPKKLLLFKKHNEEYDYKIDPDKKEEFKKYREAVISITGEYGIEVELYLYQDRYNQYYSTSCVIEGNSTDNSVKLVAIASRKIFMKS